MSKIKWVSKMMNGNNVQDFLNKYDFIPESLHITSMTREEYMDVVVTFMLRQTFNSQEELDKLIEKE